MLPDPSAENAGCVYLSHAHCFCFLKLTNVTLQKTLKCSIIFVVVIAHCRMQIRNKSAKNSVCFCYMEIVRFKIYVKLYLDSRMVLP